ncbi:ABC-2 type transport system permease protein [Saccharothrix ecbatanensis]|jgi:ABC-2 type transport system permease protein|uniref:Transport permease protein n=1 Tax=Saccharothrix ecbatanensis TaxID=1105145 RepID=A0A7W9M4Z6_9PSEU|nr:ABC transporter permease [Saccharothrix ecbatanensis]MBB5807641.1 ABC-2 type transport system permease protein [Saccharothrix ecbatanensis]
MTSLRTFNAILWRDIFVTGRELPSFLAQVIIQPFFILFIFAKVLGDIGYVQADFAAVLLPGIVAMNGFLGALQNTTLPLVLDFSWTREIEDRLLAPIPIPLVAVEKMVFGALRGLLAAVLMIPIGFVMLDVSWPVSGLPVALLVIILGSLAGAAVGMVIGTSVSPRHITVMFAVILTPLLFTGSAQFPWPALGNLRWFQVLCALNPLTYVSEGMRAVLVPNVEHMPLWVCFVVLIAAILGFGALGMRGFMRRALD